MHPLKLELAGKRPASPICTPFRFFGLPEFTPVAISLHEQQQLRPRCGDRRDIADIVGGQVERNLMKAAAVDEDIECPARQSLGA